MIMQYVIIGAGFAGVKAIESIRENDKEGDITIISDEQNYSRPLISYFLGKKVNADQMNYIEDNFFKKYNVKTNLNSKVQDIDFKETCILLEDGKTYNYDKLLIATGGSPFVPPMPEKDTQGVFTFTRYSDAKHIGHYIHSNDAKKAIILGGGLIGCKATEALMELGVEVTLVEFANRILSISLDKNASRIIEDGLRFEGCQVILEDTIEEIFSKNGCVNSVKLKGGRQIDTDLIIIAIGVRPEVSFLKKSSIKMNRGIVVNKFLETSIKNVYAAGDVAEFGSVVAILPIAARQGKTAGCNMSVSDTSERMISEESIPMNSVSLAHIPVISAGLGNLIKDIDKYEILEKYIPNEKTYRKIILLDNIIVGYILVSKINRAGILTGLIRDHINVEEFKDKLMNDNFGLVSLPKNYRKHIVQGPVFEV